MNNDFNKKILLSILVASVSVAFLAATFMMYAGAVPSTTGNYKLILSGKDNSETVNNEPPLPVVEWENNHPIMIANRADYTGAVVAAGTGKTAANNDYYVDQNENYAILLDKTFQWMIPGATDVLWYGGHGVFEDNEECSNVVDNLESMGYSVTGDNFELITESELSSYDIVVLPAFQDSLENIDSSEYGALENYVRQDDGGLFVSHESDFYGGYYADATDIMNSILQNLGFKWWFNDDTVEDPVNNFTGQPGEGYGPTINVNTSTTIGDNYQSETGSDNLGVYSVNSLRQATKVAYGVSTDPLYKNALPGSSVTFSVTAMNVSDFNPDNLELWVEDNLGWTENAKLGENSFTNVPKKGGARTTTLTVDVPANENYRVQDNITLTVSSPDNDLERTTTVSVYTSTWIKPPQSDALVQTGENAKNFGSTYYTYVGADAEEYGDERTYIKWDLSEGAPSGTIDNARLWLYEDYTSGTVGRDIALHRVENDNWSEEIITWNNQPGYDNLISKQPTENGGWLSWNVSDYISDEKASGENIVSFCLKADNEKPATGDNFSTSIVPKDDTGNRYEHPFLAFGPRPVASYATENDYGGPGDNLTVDVVINNRGAVVDNYSVVIDTDNDVWRFVEGATLVDNIVENWKTNADLKNIGPGENAVLPVTVNIPSGASLLDNENIVFSVTSQQENEYSSSTTDFGVRYGRPASVSLSAGWNLVGFPVVNENTIRSSLFEGTGVSGFNVDVLAGASLTPLGPMSDKQLLDNVGYFIKTPSDVELTTAGVPKYSDNISLSAGWNLVGFPVVNENTIRSSLFEGTGVSGFNVDVLARASLTPLGPMSDKQLLDNVGYFIKTPEPVTLFCP